MTGEPDKITRLRPRRTLSWADAMLIATLAFGGLVFLFAGAFLLRVAVPPTDRYGTVEGAVVGGPRSPDRTIPVVGTVSVTTVDGRQVASVATDARGRYSLRLRPGEYVLKATPAERGPAPAARPATIILHGGEGVTAQIWLKVGAPSASTP